MSSNSSLASYCQKIIEYSFYVLFFFVPLILWSTTSEVFEFNKMLLTYALTIIISAAWITKSIAQKKFSLRRTSLDLPILIFLLSQILSTIFSIDTHTSLWGYYSRFHGGLMSTLSYLVLYYALVSNFDQNFPYRYFLYSILGSAILVALYGVLEHLGIDKHLWVQDVQNRVFSTLGQPNWLSAYLAALLPLTTILAIYVKNKKETLFWIATSLLFFLTTLFTKSRSGIGAMFIGLALTFLFVFFQSRKNKSQYPKYLLLGFFALLIIFGSPWTPDPGAINRTLNFGGPLWPQAEKYLQKIHLTTQLKPIEVERLTNKEQELVQAEKEGRRIGGSDSFEIRRAVWSGAIELGKKYPLFGTGLETFGYSYFNVRPASHNLLSEWEFLYNKAHNEYLNFFANAGFFGLGSYLLLIFATLLWWWQNRNKTSSPFTVPGLCIGYVTILITNYYGFSVVPIALFFFLFPALSLVTTESKPHYRQFTLNLPVGLSSFIISAFAFYLLLTPLNQFRADLAYNKGRVYSLNPNYLKEATESLEKAIKLNPHEAIYYAQLAEAEATIVNTVATQVKTGNLNEELKKRGQEIIKEYQNRAIENSKKAIALNPHHTNLYKSQAKVYLYLANIDPQYTQDGLQTLLDLTKLAPTDAKIDYNIGLIYQELASANPNPPKDSKTKVLGSSTDQQDYSELAKTYFQKAVDLKPDYTAAKDQLK